MLASAAPLAAYVSPVIDFEATPGGGDASSVLAARAGAADRGAQGDAAGGVSGRWQARPGVGGQAAVGGAPVGVVSELGSASQIAATLVGGGSLPAEFASVYVALAQSPAGQSLSPSVRAARALALAGGVATSGATTASGSPRPAGAPSRPGTPGVGGAASRRWSPAQLQAAAAWAVMPVIAPGLEFEGSWSGPSAAAVGAGGAAEDQAWAGDRRTAGPGAMPTLAPAAGGAGAQRRVGGGGRRLSDPAGSAQLRVGESLQSLVAPGAGGVVEPSAAVRQPSHAGVGAGAGAIRRAPTAAQPLVTASRASSGSQQAALRQMLAAAQKQRAAGNNELPPWFEQAARHMFENQSGDGISIAEMTLVATAPSHHIAASPKSAASGSTSTAAPSASGGSESQDIEPTANVEQIAREVYAEICRLIDFARERNGDT
ncbi:MAG: hypothetical protein Tsb0020_31630 [Haliangiales bacterium]